MDTRGESSIEGHTAIQHGLPHALADGLTARPLTPDDLQAAFAVYSAAELADVGIVMLEPEDIESDWDRASFDLATQSVGVFDGDTLIGGAEVFKTRRAEAAVHPDHRGRGVGTWLADWTEDLARREGGSKVGQTCYQGSAGERLLRDRGYDDAWTSWVLELPADRPIVPQPLPAGYAIREAVTGAEDRDVYQVIEDAFNEWPDRTPSSFEDWYPRLLGRRGFEPWQIRVAVDGDDRIVGAACTILDSSGEAYIDQLAVRGDQRGKGLARALMADAFAHGRERGAARFGLSTDSRTGALGLYEKVGMQVTQTWVALAIDVAPDS